MQIDCKEVGAWFQGNESIQEIMLGNHVTSIGNGAFEGCSGLTSVDIPNSVTFIGSDAFKGTAWYDNQEDGLVYAGNVAYIYKGAMPENTGIIIKDGTTSIENYAFYGCSGLTSVEIPNSVTSIGEYAFFGCKGLTSIEIPNSVTEIGFRAFYDCSGLLHTTPSSVSIGIILEKGSPLVQKAILSQETEEVAVLDDAMAYFKGLVPQQQYQIWYIVTNEKGEEHSLTRHDIVTQKPQLTTTQPKVVSEGNVIVSATTNLDDEESNVGFEWRSTDWTNEFPSNTSAAYLYDGTIEGCIKNMNTRKLWKCRPYYLSNSGVYYYGDWMGIDPTNTFYYDPTVRTYPQITINGNTALVKGYVLSGTDEVEVQGFKYWRIGSGSHLNKAVAVPTDAMTVEVNGQQMMTASLEGLDYDSEYCCVAFVTTTEGATFYGEEQTFVTGADPTGIESIEAEDTEDAVIEIARYNMNGQLIDAPQDGVNIIRYSDGTTKKIFVK